MESLDDARLREHYIDIGSDKPFLLNLVETYHEQVNEFINNHSVATNEDLAEMTHRLAGSSFQVASREIVEAMQLLESQLRNEIDHVDTLKLVVSALPDVARQFGQWARNLPDNSTGVGPRQGT